MQPPDIEHWFEVLAGGLIALGAWLFRLGRKYQQQENELKTMAETIVRMERELAEEVRKRSDRDRDFFERLRKIEAVQTEHGVKIDGIAACSRRIEDNVQRFLINCRPGGNRASDPPA